MEFKWFVIPPLNALSMRITQIAKQATQRNSEGIATNHSPPLGSELAEMACWLRDPSTILLTKLGNWWITAIKARVQCSFCHLTSWV